MLENLIIYNRHTQFKFLSSNPELNTSREEVSGGGHWLLGSICKRALIYIHSLRYTGLFQGHLKGDMGRLDINLGSTSPTANLVQAPSTWRFKGLLSEA